MTSISIDYFAKSLLDKSNRTSNDYHAYGRSLPGNPPPLFGQQYGIWLPEARALKAAIEKEGWFKDPMLPQAPPMDLRAAILERLAYLSTPAAAEKMPKGTIDLSNNAARFLNQYAREIGSNARFSAKQNTPIHPVG